MSFSQRLNELMTEFGYSNYRLAKELECPQSSVANWTKGRTVPHKSTLSRLADVFGVSVEYLKGETDDRGKKETPAPEGERVTQETKDALMQAARTSILIEAFEKLPVEAQNEAIGRILLEVQNLKQQGNQK